MSENSQWVSVNEAAAAAQLPVRTVYNWVNSETVASRKQDGITVVCMEEVLARAQERAAADPALPALVPPALVPASDASTKAASEALSPELLAHLIRLIEQGVDLPEIVQELRLPTALALDAKRQYDALVAASGRPSLRQLMSELVAHVDSRLAESDARLNHVERDREGLRQRIIQDVRATTAHWYSEFDTRISDLSRSFHKSIMSCYEMIKSLQSSISDVVAMIREHMRGRG